MKKLIPYPNILPRIGIIIRKLFLKKKPLQKAIMLQRVLTPAKYRNALSTLFLFGKASKEDIAYTFISNAVNGTSV
jgi:hypothetical protein